MQRTKKVCAGLLVLAILFLLVAIGVYSYGEPKAEFAYSQEYVAGTGNIKGDVDVEYYESHGEEFAIGANSQGYAVFKDPRAAMNCICKDYKEGLKLMRKTWGCPPFFRFQYHGYSIGGCTVDQNEKGADQVEFILAFLGIYENSFPYEG